VGEAPQILKLLKVLKAEPRFLGMLRGLYYQRNRSKTLKHKNWVQIFLFN